MKFESFINLKLDGTRIQTWTTLYPSLIIMSHRINGAFEYDCVNDIELDAVRRENRVHFQAGTQWTKKFIPTQPKAARAASHGGGWSMFLPARLTEFRLPPCLLYTATNLRTDRPVRGSVRRKRKNGRHASDRSDRDPRSQKQKKNNNNNKKNGEGYRMGGYQKKKKKGRASNGRTDTITG